MAKIIIFDLDGVLIDSKDIHYNALNKALCDIDAKYKISFEDHIKIYNGLPTKEKLKILSEKTNLDKSTFDIINKNKQTYTFDMLNDVSEDIELIDLFKLIKNNNIKICVASNSIRKTVELILTKLNIIDLVDYIVSNEDVKNPKPFPEMYWKCMSEFNAIPKDVVIFEDSIIGKIAVLDSGASLVEIKDRKDLTLEKINNAINILKYSKHSVLNKKINIVIPMAGKGSRFLDAGFSFPKPLIDINGMPMIELVVNNIALEGNYIFIVRKDHYEKYNLFEMLTRIVPDCKIITVDEEQSGAASTCLHAKNYINTEDPLFIINSDQYIDWNPKEFLYNNVIKNLDGSILLFKSTHPKWSYAKLDEFGMVVEVAEKVVISDNATVGGYYWGSGHNFVKYAEQMIEKNIRVNNEFYVCPVYNEAIKDNKKIGSYFINKMYGLGTPEDLEKFMRFYNND